MLPSSVLGSAGGLLDVSTGKPHQQCVAGLSFAMTQGFKGPCITARCWGVACVLCGLYGLICECVQCCGNMQLLLLYDACTVFWPGCGWVRRLRCAYHQFGGLHSFSLLPTWVWCLVHQIMLLVHVPAHSGGCVPCAGMYNHSFWTQ
jgi:hypothetical protein